MQHGGIDVSYCERQDHRTAARLVEEVAAESVADVRFDGRPFRDFLVLAFLECLLDAGFRLVHERFQFAHVDEAARDDIRARDDAAGLAIHRHDDDEDAVLRELAAITQHDVADIADACVWIATA